MKFEDRSKLNSVGFAVGWQSKAIGRLNRKLDAIMDYLGIELTEFDGYQVTKKDDK